MRFLARGTQLPAVVAQLAAAPLAAVRVVMVYRGTAVAATDAAPIVQLDEGATAGVGMEDLGDQQEEVQYPALR